MTGTRPRSCITRPRAICRRGSCSSASRGTAPGWPRSMTSCRPSKSSRRAGHARWSRTGSRSPARARGVSRTPASGSRAARSRGSRSSGQRATRIAARGFCRKWNRAFARLPGTLEPIVAPEGTQRIDLISGLEMRRPERARSGFFVDASGAVLTTAEAVRGCGRITLDESFEAESPMSIPRAASPCCARANASRRGAWRSSGRKRRASCHRWPLPDIPTKGGSARRR